MSTRHGRRPGRLARRAVLGATAAWFATVGGVAGVSWLAIQSAGYAVTGSRVIGISLDAPPAVAAHPTAAATARPGSGTASTSRSAAVTRTGHVSASVTASPSTTPASVGATTAPGVGQGSHNGGRGGGSSTGAPQAGGQNPPADGQSTTTGAPTSSVGGRTNGPLPTTPTSTAATSSSASSSSSQSGSGATSQSTPGGLVVAECTGDLVHWSVEPASGWSTLQSQKIEHGVKTGFRRSERVVAVTITCDHGSPTIDVSATSSD